jgi:hypothetical protein
MIELFIQKIIKDNEHFNNNDEYVNNDEYGIVWLFWNLFWFGVSCVAVYLSWTCKSNEKQNIFLRIFFAILAYIFGIFYIIVNLFFNDCRTTVQSS